MEKAYDIKELGNKLKSKGLDLAEEGAKIVVEETLAWIEESAIKSPTPYDNIIAALIPTIKPLIMEEIDKIDGKEG